MVGMINLCRRKYKWVKSQTPPKKVFLGTDDSTEQTGFLPTAQKDKLSVVPSMSYQRAVRSGFLVIGGIFLFKCSFKASRSERRGP